MQTLIPIRKTPTYSSDNIQLSSSSSSLQKVIMNISSNNKFLETHTILYMSPTSPILQMEKQRKRWYAT